MDTVWLGLGSNLGDRNENIFRAFASCSRFLHEARLSGIWESKPRYVENQPSFLNAVMCGLTDLDPRTLLDAVQKMELELGRVREGAVPKGPRIIDIDILLIGSRIIAEPDLIVPHPAMRERKFVLLPLLDLDPDLVDPVSGSPFSSFLFELPPQGIYPLGREGYYAPYP
ncbi:MAG TPA: 2-amino-4-hydroxy-6-hydroxymethyldihydropteridine diphosphokinase [Rectinemataceae bacterium]